MKKLIYILGAFMLAGAWYACTPPLEGVTLKLPVALANSNVVVQFQPSNVSAGDLPSNIKITLGGADTAKVVNSVGGKTLAVKQNVLTLAAKSNSVPSANAPIKFFIIAEADGYLRSITPVEITSTKDQNLVVKLTKIAVPPTGVSVVQQPATVPASGTTSAPITAATSTTSTVQEKATVNIPSGVTMKDGDGQTVGGSVNVVVTKTDATKTPVNIDLSDVSKVLDKNNQPIPSFTFKPVVGMDIEISNDKNQKVKSFSGQIDVQTEFPTGATDPTTGKPLAAGDLIAIASYDEDTKVFKYEGSVKLTTNANGKLEAKGTINHLTSVFFASYNGITVSGNSNNPSDVAAAKAAFGDNVTPAMIMAIKSYSLAFGGSVGQYASETFIVDVNDGAVVFETTDRLNNSIITPNAITKIVVKNSLGEVITTVNNPYPSGSSATINMPAPPNFIELQANLKCKDANKTSNADNIHMYAKKAGGGYFYIGKATRNASNIITATSTILKRGGVYDFMFDVGGILFYYDNQTVTTGSVHSINSSMPDVLCK